MIKAIRDPGDLFYFPSKYKEALRFFVDPERMQYAGFSNDLSSNLFIDYSMGGAKLEIASLDPMFTDSPSKWVKAYGTYVDENEKFMGRKTVFLSRNDGSGWRGHLYNDLNSNAFAIKPNTIYQLHFNYKAAPSQVNTGLFVRINTYDQNNNFLYRVGKKNWTTGGDRSSGGGGFNLPIEGNDYWKTYSYTLEPTPNDPAMAKATMQVATDNANTGDYGWMSYLFLYEVKNGNHGFIYGGAESSGWGVEKVGIQLDGVNDYIKIGDRLNIGSNSFIIAFWVKNSLSTGGVYNIIDKRDNRLGSGGIGYCMGVYNGNLSFGMGDGTNFVYTNTTMSTTNISDNVWHLVAIVCDRGSAIGYVDNVKGSTVDVSTIGSLDNTSALMIGKQSYGDAEYYGGMIGMGFMYIFDGQGGAPSSLPSDYESIIADIWDNTRSKYGV